ncbi:unannotated protein [freshwater metagenome]|uniref:Unannotated protein n=1 Tax=freshwater metagenome TaxID=449393 RepID=A0A6J5YI40_9ZZZZ
MLGIDAATSRSCRFLDHRHGTDDVVGRTERGEPTIADPSDPTQFAGGDAAEPDLKIAFHRARQHLYVGHRIELALVGDELTGPAGPHEGESFIMTPASLRALHTERTVLCSLGGAQPHRRQQTPVGEHVECGQFLGQQYWIPTRKNEHRGAEFELLGASGGHSERNQRVGGVRSDAFGHPQRIEAQFFEAIDEMIETVRRSGGGEGPEADADTNFQR